MKFIFSTGQNLVRVGLVSHIPDDLVFRAIHGGMERHGQLDHAEAWGEMPAVFRDDIANKRSDFTGKRFELRNGKFLQILRTMYGIQNHFHNDSITYLNPPLFPL